MGYKREQYSEVMARINEPRGKIQVIVGPRQVGKSTLIGQVLEVCNMPYDSYSADDVVGASADWLAGVWQTARMRMDIRGRETPIGGRRNTKDKQLERDCKG